MSDFISREAAANGLAKIIIESDMPEDWNKGMSAAVSALFRIPAADVRPVVEARWNVGADGWECSNCAIESNNTYPICPYCGAMMEES